MSDGWKRSGLRIGEEIRMPVELFQDSTRAPERFVKAKYLGETECFLTFEFEFRPSIGNTTPNKYRRSVDWGSIYCGQVKLYKKDGEPIKAERSVPPIILH